MKRFSLRIPAELHEKLRKESFETGSSINEIILEAIKQYKKGECKMLVECLKILEQEDLLNEVGAALVGHPERFPETFEEMERFFEGKDREEILDALSTSSLVGHDTEKAIADWVFEAQEMEKILKGEY